MKLIKILREIGENTAKPYPLTTISDSKGFTNYSFETDTDIIYRIVIDKGYKVTADSEDYDPDDEENYDMGQIQFAVAFGVEQPLSKSIFTDYSVEFKDVKNLFRVMATVIEAIKKTIEDNKKWTWLPVTRIVMEPVKSDEQDTRRSDLYKRFIKKNMPPGSIVWENENQTKIFIDLPKK